MNNEIWKLGTVISLIGLIAISGYLMIQTEPQYRTHVGTIQEVHPIDVWGKFKIEFKNTDKEITLDTDDYFYEFKTGRKAIITTKGEKLVSLDYFPKKIRPKKVDFDKLCLKRGTVEKRGFFLSKTNGIIFTISGSKDIPRKKEFLFLLKKSDKPLVDYEVIDYTKMD